MILEDVSLRVDDPHKRQVDPYLLLSLLGALLFSVIMITNRDALLPERFDYDAGKIQSLAQGSFSGESDLSYDFISQFYSILGIANSQILAGLLGLTIALITLWLALSRSGALGFKGAQTCVAAAVFVLLSSVFVGTFSKEVLVLIVPLVVLSTFRMRVSDYAVCAVMVGMGILYRPYWLLVAIGYLILRVVTSRSRNVWWLILTGAGLVVLFCLLLLVFQGVQPGYYRESINSGRSDAEDVGSLISPVVSIDTPVGGLIDTVVTLLRLIVPLDLALLGGVYYVGLAIGLLILWVQFFWNYDTLASQPSERGENALRGKLVSQSVSVVIAFLAVQALFEPDFGSVLRHLTPLLPLIFMPLWSREGSRRALYSEVKQ